MPPNPKHPSRPGRPAVELPFDDGDAAPHREYPSNPTVRKPPRKAEEVIPTSVYELKPQKDEEFPPSYNQDGDESGFKPAFVYVERGPGQGQLVPVRQGVTVIGRASVAELRLQHPSISRRHAQIVRKGEFFYVKDLGSQNGTYVNAQKISSEVEVHPGDELAVGSALLKLRGPVKEADSASVPSVKISRPKKKGSSGALKVALFAGAVGFGLAAFMMYALLANQQKNKPSFFAGTAKAEPVVAPEHEDAVDVEISADDPVSVKIQQAMAKQEVPAPQPVEAVAAVAVEKEQPKREVVRAPPASAVAAAKGDLKRAPKVVTASAKSSKIADAFEDEAEAAPARVAAAAPTGNNAAQILARYEAGNVDAAIGLADKAGNTALLGKLQAFKSSYDGAKKAFASNNAAGAIKGYEKALSVDEQLSSGWGSYGIEIRKQLATIYTLVGQHYASNDSPAEAKKAFGVALKHDPANAKARAGLAAVANAQQDDEEEAPAKKAPAPKKARAAIDDAFGD